MSKTIITVFGCSCAGKSTVADMLKKLLGASVINFADPVKEVARVMIGIPLAISHGTQDDKANTVFYDKSARAHLQWIGTEVGRDGVSNTVWVDRFIDAALNDSSDVIIAGDGRFPENEAVYLSEAAAKKGVRVITAVIRRPSVPVNMSHRSESVVADTPNDTFDWVFTNDRGLPELTTMVEEFIDWTHISRSSKERQDYIVTYTGKKYFPLTPDSKDVDKVDIAHGVAKTDRWNRQADRVVSVGLHSVNVMKLVRFLGGHANIALVMLYALLHDAHEAYMADMPSPLKAMIPGWMEIEDKNDKAIFEHFGLAWPIPPEIFNLVRRADQDLATIEGYRFTKHNDMNDLGVGPSEEIIKLAGLSWDIDGDFVKVRELFLHYLEPLLILNAGSLP